MAESIYPEPVAIATGVPASGHAVPYLVLAHPTDETAIAVAALLRQRHGPFAVELRSPEELLVAPQWDHRVSAAGIKTEIGMGDGSPLAGNAPCTIFNRIRLIDPPQFQGAAQHDRDYARMEMFALLLSWLAHPGCPVINRPSPNALAGSAYRLPMWHRLAQLSGLTTVELVGTSSTRRFPACRTALRRPDVTHALAHDCDGRRRPNDFSWFSEPIDVGRTSLLAIGGQIPADAPAALSESCRRLAQLADTDILRIDFVPSADSPSGWAFVGADPFPEAADSDSLLRIVNLLEAAASTAVVGMP